MTWCRRISCSRAQLPAMRTVGATLVQICLLLRWACASQLTINEYLNPDCNGPLPDGETVEFTSGLCYENHGKQFVPVDKVPYIMFMCSNSGSQVTVEYFSDHDCKSKLDYDALVMEQLNAQFCEQQAWQTICEKFLHSNAPHFFVHGLDDPFNSGQCTTIFDLAASPLLQAVHLPSGLSVNYTVTNCYGNELKKTEEFFTVVLCFVIGICVCCVCCVFAACCFMRKSRERNRGYTEQILMPEELHRVTTTVVNRHASSG